MNILAFGSHPDDIEVCCAGTLFKYRAQGCKIHIALTTSGNIGSNAVESREEIASIRESEQLASAAMLDAQVKFLRYDDELLIDTPELRRDVLNAIRWANPDVILTHSVDDQSPDHAVTGKVVGEVMLSLPSKLIPADEPPITKKPSLFYWDTAAGVGFLPEAYVDITDFIDMKIRALSVHKSQMEWMSTFQDDDFFESIRILSQFRGLQCGCKFAEAFRAFRLHGYMPDFRLLP
ncbi:MAG: PIG-L deacetylase family protein [Armatimonadota bacterium]